MFNAHMQLVLIGRTFFYKMVRNIHAIGSTLYGYVLHLGRYYSVQLLKYGKRWA